MSAPKKDRALSGNMLYPAPPKTILALERLRHPDTISLARSNKNLGFSIFWSSMFLTDIPIISGRNPSIVSLRADCASFSIIKSTIATSCPDFRVAAATHARPRGKVVIFIFSVLAEMRRTFIALSELPPTTTYWQWHRSAKHCDYAPFLDFGEIHEMKSISQPQLASEIYPLCQEKSNNPLRKGVNILTSTTRKDSS